MRELQIGGHVRPWLGALGAAAVSEPQLWLLPGLLDATCADHHRIHACAAAGGWGAHHLPSQTGWRHLGLSLGAAPYAKAIDIAFGVPTLRLREAQAVYQLPLDDFDAVAEATRNCVPMVQQTEVRGSDGLRAVIELPVKTMNIAQQTSMPSHHPARTWQTDTGPVAVPDLSRHHARASDALSLVRAVHAYMHVTLACNNAGWAGGGRGGYAATTEVQPWCTQGFVAINSIQPDVADFVVEQPTPFKDAEVLHFSHTFNLPARSRLLCIPPPLWCM
jgi:hypothetical protein